MSNTVKLWLKLGTIMASTVFFIFSCTATMMTGARVLPRLDARHIDAGDTPHEAFYVLAVSKEDADSISAILLSEAREKFSTNAAVSFLLPEDSGASDNFQGAGKKVAGAMEYQYTAKQTGNNEQQVILDVTDRDQLAGKYHYRVSGNDIVPLYSRLTHFSSTGITAFAIAIIISLLLHITGRGLVRHFSRQTEH
jgi:hypothetical protein